MEFSCLGAIDGKHIEIKAPPDSGSYYYNYKGRYSIVLLAISDANSEFIYVDVGTNGRVSDGGVWDDSTLSTWITNYTAGLPPDTKLPGSDLCSWQTIMKPFPHAHQSRMERIFSYRLSRARRTVENAFGMLANRFRVFLTPIHLAPEKVETIVLSCTALHNFLRRDQVAKYIQHEGSLEHEDVSLRTVVPGVWRDIQQVTGLQRVGINSTVEGKHVRNEYVKYFNQEGALHWQDTMIPQY